MEKSFFFNSVSLSFAFLWSLLGRRLGARSIRPKFPVQNRMKQKVSLKSFHLSSFWKFGNLEIPEISCSIWHFYPVWIFPSSFSLAVKRNKIAASLSESTLHWLQNNVPQFKPILDFLFSTLGSDFIGKFITWRGNSALNCTRKPISHESRSDECDIGFQVQFNAEFSSQVMNFPWIA